MAAIGEGIERRDFMLTLAAIGASAALIRCGDSSNTNGTVSVVGGKVTLPLSQFPALASPGGGVVVEVQGGNPLVVLRKDATTVVALTAVCTHQGCTVNYAGSGISCPCHGSRYDLTGQVTQGPATQALRSYPAVVDGSAVTVTVA